MESSPPARLGLPHGPATQRAGFSCCLDSTYSRKVRFGDKFLCVVAKGAGERGEGPPLSFAIAFGPCRLRLAPRRGLWGALLIKHERCACSAEANVLLLPESVAEVHARMIASPFRPSCIHLNPLFPFLPPLI